MQIAHELNENSIPSPGAHKKMKHQDLSGKWIDKTVMRVVQNSAYIGQLIGYQHVTIDGRVTPTNQEEHVTISIPAIIDLETWERAQYRLNHARHLWYIRRQGKREYLLNGGMVRCSKCGYAMSGSRTKKSTEKYYFYYRCSGETKRLFMKRNCSNRLHVEDLDFTVWDFIERLATDTRTTLALYRQEQAAHEALFAENQQRIGAIDELLHENHEEQKRLNWMYQKRRCDDGYFEAEWARLAQERQALEREREKAERVLEKQVASARQLKELEAIGQEIREATEEISLERKRHILERLRTVITVEPSQHRGKKPADEERSVVIEVLGYAKRVSVKRHSPS